MATDSWYRNTTWDDAIEAEFETRLKRARGTYSKSQYLRIQAGILLASQSKHIQLVGIQLTNRLVKDYATEEFSVIFGQECLGDYYLRVGQFEKAEIYYRVVVQHCQNKQSRSGTSAKADLKLAEALFVSNKADKLEEAYQLCQHYPKIELSFDSDAFYYTSLMAQLCSRIDKKDKAREFAIKALELAEISNPQFTRHKTVGLVQADSKLLQLLEQIAKD